MSSRYEEAGVSDMVNLITLDEESMVGNLKQRCVTASPPAPHRLGEASAPGLPVTAAAARARRRPPWSPGSGL